MKKIIYLILVLILVSSSYAIDSIVCVPLDVFQGATITCEVDLALGKDERNQAYNLSFYNDTEQNIPLTGCSFTGTTENIEDPPNVIQGCSIPSEWEASTTAVANFTLTEIPDSISFDFNITETTTADLLINNFVVESPCYVGESCGLRFDVSKSDTSKKIIGAECFVDALELVGGVSVPISNVGKELSQHGGRVLIETQLDSETFTEGSSYILDVRCDCRPGDSSCINEEGELVIGKDNLTGLSGVGTSTLSVNTWLEVSTTVGMISVKEKQLQTVSVNVTNNRSDIRVPMEITYSCRINVDDENSTRRIKSPFYFLGCERIGECVEKRSISPAVTQHQSTDFKILEHPFLQGRTTEAYCSTIVKIVDVITELVSYRTTSETFNITVETLNLEPDWQWIEDKKMNSIVNLSDWRFDDWNGTGTGNIDLRIHFHEDQSVTKELDLKHSIEILNLIKNITVENLTDSLIEHTNFELEFTEDGHIEIELRDVPLSKHDEDTWWNVTIEFYDFDKRQTEASEGINESGYRSAEALEGIENKTGTFHLELICPDPAYKGKNMECKIIAYIEDDQVVQKEVDFTCYIDEKNIEEINFNSMITRVPSTIKKEFNIEFLPDGTKHTLFCMAGYYNLGSRTDTFSDTFTVQHGGGRYPIELIKDISEGIRDFVKEKIDESPFAFFSLVTAFLVVTLIMFVYRQRIKSAVVERLRRNKEEW